MKAVSARLFSAAMHCINLSSGQLFRMQTAAGLPPKSFSEKASTWYIFIFMTSDICYIFFENKIYATPSFLAVLLPDYFLQGLVIYIGKLSASGIYILTSAAAQSHVYASFSQVFHKCVYLFFLRFLKFCRV